MILDEFANYGWKVGKHTPEEIVYVLKDREFKIEYSDNNIIVRSPIKNSDYIYRTSFKNRVNASAYILDHLNYIMEKN